MFEVGQSYKNNIGIYEVLAIHNDKMEVCYSDGHTQILSVATQARINNNRIMKQEYIPNSPKSKRRINYSYSDYWTLGFLLARITYLQLKVEFGHRDKARDEYFEATGEELDTVKTGVFKYPKGTNQWSNQGVITFRASESELSLLRFNSTPSPANSPNTYVVSDIRYLYLMLENGFRLGAHQDNGKIIGSIPTANKDAFGKGFDYGL